MSRRVVCPVCGRGPADKTCVVFEDGKVHCHRCGPEGWKPIKDALGTGNGPVTGLPRPAECHTTMSDWGLAMWRECRPLDGVALDYLEARRCTLPPADGDLRWHPALKAGDHVGPALVGLVTDFATNEPLTLHRTWIRADGTKDGPGRLFLRGHRKKGGVIRLWPDEAVTRGLFLAEGVESALSVAREFTPVWCALDAGNLRGLPVLPGVECLTVFADKDANGTGELAALELCEHWQAAGREAEMMAPRIFGDANDVARAGQ